MEENRPVPLFDNFINLEDVGEKWIEWLDAYERYAELSEISSKGQKLMISALLFYAGQKVSRIYDTISLKDDDYDAVKEKLTSYFNPNLNEETKQATDTSNPMELPVEIKKIDQETKLDDQAAQKQNENPISTDSEANSKKSRLFPSKPTQIQKFPTNDLSRIKSSHLEVNN